MRRRRKRLHTLEGTGNGAKPFVMYVEDNEINRIVLQGRLHSQYHLLIATTDREACECVRQYGNALQGIIMDIELQGSVLDGIQLAQLFSGESPESIDQPLPAYAQDLPIIRAPIVFLTAYVAKYGPQNVGEAMAGPGGMRMLPKPVDFAELEQAMPIMAA